MIRKHSIDPDVAAAASEALTIIDSKLNNLPPATSFDYGGHVMQIGDYDVCEACTRPIAEAQQAHAAITEHAESVNDPAIKEHLDVAASLLKAEADAATIRAQLHNGLGSEKIVNRLNGFKHDRGIGDDYSHSHHQGAE